MSFQFPSLDCHAHVSPDVTKTQLRQLGHSVIFAVTRSLEEAESVISRNDFNLVWGCGVHPGVRKAIAGFELSRFSNLIPRFAFIGEIGMDCRSGHLVEQAKVLRSILNVAHQEPVLLSLHSTGCVSHLLGIIAERPHPGIILHWFLGDSSAVEQAASLGCYFSVNAAMSDGALASIPLERMLPETDFPTTTRKGGGTRPGDIEYLERRVAKVKKIDVADLRRKWYQNLRAASVASGALDRLPDEIADYILIA